MVNARGQKEFFRSLKAVYNGRCYVYNVLFFDKKHPDWAPRLSLDMTEEKFRELAAEGEFPEVSNIDEALRNARETADRKVYTNSFSSSRRSNHPGLH